MTAEYGGSEAQLYAYDIPRDRQTNDSAASPDLVRLYLNSLRNEPDLEAHEEVSLAQSMEAGLFAESVLSWQAVDAETPEAAEAVREKLYEAICDARYGTRLKAKMSQEDKEFVYDEAVAWADMRIDIIRNHAGIPRDELEALAAEGRWARQEMIERNTKLVVSVAKKFHSERFPLLARISWGNSGLIDAVERFDYSKGFKFSTYATNWIKKRIQQGFAQEGYAIPLSTYDDDNIMKIRNVIPALKEQGIPVNTDSIMTATGFPKEKVLEWMGKNEIHASLDMPLSPDADRLEGSMTLGDVLLEEFQQPYAPEPDPEIDAVVGNILAQMDEETRGLVILSRGLFGNQRLEINELALALAEQHGRPKPYDLDVIRNRLRRAEATMRQIAATVLDQELQTAAA